MRIEDDNLIVSLEGHIDSGNAIDAEAMIRNALEAHPDKALVLDLEHLDYISSAGLRVLLAVSKRSPKPMTLINASPEVYDVLDMTGFTTLFNVERRMREIDVTGCEVIGRGAIGTVYRIDADTIVKVYNVPNALAMIRNEQRRAKQAFLKGVPTAISYDAVRVGDRYGSVFEMVDAKTYNDLLVEHPEDADDILRGYAGIIQQVHAIEAKPGELPDCREIYLQYIDEIGDSLPPALSDRLRTLFREMPEDLHLIHGDFHMKNMMLTGGESLLIDMDTLSVGNPVFDFAGIYVAYRAFNEHDPNNSMDFLEIPEEMCEKIWRTTLEICVDAPDAAAFEEKKKRVVIVASVRFLYLLTVLRLGGDALRDIRIRDTIRRLEALTDEVEGLEI